jgi:hypothetical protein
MLASAAKTTEAHIWVGAPFAVALILQVAGVLSAWFVGCKTPQRVKGRLEVEKLNAEASKKAVTDQIATLNSRETGIKCKQDTLAAEGRSRSSEYVELETELQALRTDAQELKDEVPSIERSIENLDINNLPESVRPAYIGAYAIWAIDASQAFVTVLAPVATLAVSGYERFFSSNVGIASMVVCVLGGVVLLFYAMARPNVPRYVARIKSPLTPVSLLGLLLNVVFLILLLTHPPAS